MRIDKSQGWHIDNVKLMNRTEAMKRPRLTDSKGNVVRRKKRNG